MKDGSVGTGGLHAGHSNVPRNADVIRADHDKRGLSHESIDEVIRLDEAWRKARYDADQLRRKRNELPWNCRC